MTIIQIQIFLYLSTDQESLMFILTLIKYFFITYFKIYHRIHKSFWLNWFIRSHLIYLQMGKTSATSRGIKEACDDCGNCSDFTTTGKLRALLQKNFLRMWRNVGVMLFIFALPVMQVILFCLAIGGDPKGLKLAIVNHERNFTNLTYQVNIF